MKIVTVHEAKTTLSKLIQRVLAGEEVIIARGDEPVVRLIPIAASAPARTFGALKGRFTVTGRFFEPLPAEELDAWER
jgi:prevent-host-death family protein